MQRPSQNSLKAYAGVFTWTLSLWKNSFSSDDNVNHRCDLIGFPCLWTQERAMLYIALGRFLVSCLSGTYVISKKPHEKVHSHLIKRKSHLPTHAINIDTPRRSLHGKKKSVISRIFATRQIKATPANLRSENSGNQRVDSAQRRKSECGHFNGTRSRDAHLGIVPVLSNARRSKVISPGVAAIAIINHST